MQGRAQGFLRFAAKLAAVAAGVYLLVAFDMLDARGLGAAWTYRVELAAVSLVYLGTTVLAAARWYLLLRVVNFPVPLRDTVAITLISFFFSSFLPGAVSGDGVRVAYVFAYRKLHGADSNLRRTVGITAILADRAIGLFGLLLFTSAAVGVGLAAGLRNEVLERMGLLVFAALLLGVAVAIGGFAFAATVKRLAEAKGWFRGERLSRALALIEALLLLRRSRATLLAGIAISVVNQAIATAVLWLIMGFLAMGGVDGLSFILAASVAMVANVLPITPGGIGVAEVTFDQLLRMLQPAAFAIPFGTAFLVLRLVALSSSLVGAAVFIFYRLRRREFVGG